MSSADSVARWLESPEGERWSSSHHRAAHAGESDLPNHIASVRPAPGEDPFWDRAPSSLRLGARDPAHDPSGRPPTGLREARATRPTRGRSR